MKVSLDFPWRRYALIAELARRLEEKSPQFGKTALQKMVYLLQEAFGIDCGYEFELYTYGPFTSQLLHDLDVVEHMGGVSVHPVRAITGGYLISPGEKADMLREKGAEFLDDENVKKAIVSLVDGFGCFVAKDLELRSTIVYVQRDFIGHRVSPSREEVVKVIKQIKPKFKSGAISEAVEELAEQGYISLS